ncbi:hypothetical protein [Anaerovorax odorimutans]|uniref:hypothetical protein n=1 Tax=Anaerovorax odorimutans TaxID=109327 RepID=UPI0003F6D50B|nr:hypothetical protein [Anaerovorax odorimutans]
MNDIERTIEIIKNVDICCNAAETARDLAIQALEKQIPKKIFHEPWVGIDGVPYDLCPNCETNLCTTGLLANNKDDYCPSCGQRLDWSGEDE